MLEEREFPVDELYLYASENRRYRVNLQGEKFKVRALNKETSFKGIDIALFSAGSAVSKEYALVLSRMAR